MMEKLVHTGWETHHLTASYLQVVGACWYLLAVDRQVTCWKNLCPHEANCNDAFFDCSSLHPSYLLSANRASWMSITNISTNCDTANNNNYFNFGIYADALNYNITTSSIEFMEKYFYCVWMGLLSLRWVVPCHFLSRAAVVIIDWASFHALECCLCHQQVIGWSVSNFWLWCYLGSIVSAVPWHKPGQWAPIYGKSSSLSVSSLWACSSLPSLLGICRWATNLCQFHFAWCFLFRELLTFALWL